MIAVMTDDDHQVFQKIMPQREVPVEFGSPLAVVMGYELSEKSCVFREMNDILEAEIPPVFRAGIVVVTGKGAGRLEMSEKFAVDSDSVLHIQRIFIEPWPVYEDLLCG